MGTLGAWLGGPTVPCIWVAAMAAAPARDVLLPVIVFCPAHAHWLAGACTGRVLHWPEPTTWFTVPAPHVQVRCQEVGAGSAMLLQAALGLSDWCTRASTPHGCLASQQAGSEPALHTWPCAPVLDTSETACPSLTCVQRFARGQLTEGGHATGSCAACGAEGCIPHAACIVCLGALPCRSQLRMTKRIQISASAGAQEVHSGFEGVGAEVVGLGSRRGSSGFGACSTWRRVSCCWQRPLLRCKRLDVLHLGPEADCVNARGTGRLDSSPDALQHHHLHLVRLACQEMQCHARPRLCAGKRAEQEQ